MKHLIIFLNYCQSRIQNPVYRQFSMAPLANRNTTLLFLSKPLDERELSYEVSMLRRKEEVPSPVTFHICATLDRPDTGAMVAQTLTLIRKVFADSLMLAYCLMPDLKTCTDAERNAAWKSLVTINSTVTDYQDIHFLRTCFLYSDATQQSLAHFLYDYTQYDEVQQLVPGMLHSTTITAEEEQKSDFPPIFSTFSATGLTYPEDDIRFHLQQFFINALLSYTQPEVNPISMEVCLDQALSILSKLPLSLEQLCLQEAEFINLSADEQKQWDEPAAYWENAIALARTGIKDTPREDWLHEFQTRLEVLFQRRFRDFGVEYFYSYEQKKISDYNRIILSGIHHALTETMLSNPFPPETQKDIVRAIVNQLQQRVLQVDQAQSQAILQVKQIKAKLEEHIQHWGRMGLFDRMRGKDTELLTTFEQDLCQYYVLRTVIPGCQFATKLLNELIPQISALSEDTDHVTSICREALHSTFRSIEESDPSSLCEVFPSESILNARDAIKLDKDYLLNQYLHLVEILYGRNKLIDGDDLLQRMRNMFTEEFNVYLRNRIADGTLPAVLELNIAERLASIYDGHGGLSRFLYEIKQQTALNLMLKTESGNDNTDPEPVTEDQYMLISPDHADLRDNVKSHSTSNLQMLHTRFHISLTDLDGFSGQRMFVEPSIF